MTYERLEEAVTRILALKAKVCLEEVALPEIDAKAWQKTCAEASVTLVKNNNPQALPLTPEKFPRIRLVLLGEDQMIDGQISSFATQYLEERGFEVSRYQPLEDDLHGTSRLDEKCLTLYLANLATASNQTTVRLAWCKKHALDTPRFVNEEVSIFVSLANTYHLQDIPRVKTYINAYTATQVVLEAVLDKLVGRGTFVGVSPVDAFCGLPDTRL